MTPARFDLHVGPLRAEGLMRALSDETVGGVVTFEGRVRNHNEGKSVDRLEYEVYPELALREGERIVNEACERFEIVAAHCHHRVGPLRIEDMAVWVGVSAAHRGAAFEACRYVIDELKHRLPIWKKEHYTDGDAEWVFCKHDH